jgi:hypothetical protein
MAFQFIGLCQNRQEFILDYMLQNKNKFVADIKGFIV